MSREMVVLELLTPDMLADLGEQAFAEVVGADLRRHASNEKIRTNVPAWISEDLRGRLAERRLSSLRRMLASVDSQLEDTPWNELDKPARVRSAHRFRSALLEALPEAERLAEGRVLRLQTAIAAHQAATLADGTIEPSQADRDLWAVLE